MPQVHVDGGGLWMAQLTDVRVTRSADVLAWRALAARLDSGATPVVMEMREPRLIPWPLDGNGNPITAQYEAANNDDSTFDDGTSYVSDVISAETYAAADLRATTLRLRLLNASALKGGEHFSIQHDTFNHRLYRIANVLDLGPSGGNDAFTKVLLALIAGIADTNVGGSAHTWTLNGNAVISGGSLLLDGTGDFGSTPDHADYTVGSGDLTIDGEFFCDAAGGGFRIICGKTITSSTGANADRSFVLLRNTSNLISGTLYVGSSAFAVTGTTQFTSTLFPGWHHVALQRVGSTLLLSVDGRLEASGAVSGTVNDTNGPFSIGRSGDENFGADWQGRLRRFRLSVGVARWPTGNFTPPQLPYDTKPGNVWEVGIRPPLRETTAAAARAEFDYPKCVMKLAKPDAMNLPLELRFFGRGNIALVEDFPPFNVEPA
jgi:hypothetical protein